MKLLRTFPLTHLFIVVLFVIILGTTVINQSQHVLYTDALCRKGRQRSRIEVESEEENNTNYPYWIDKESSGTVFRKKTVLLFPHERVLPRYCCFFYDLASSHLSSNKSYHHKIYIYIYIYIINICATIDKHTETIT
jgi:hypothetical protein